MSDFNNENIPEEENLNAENEFLESENENAASAPSEEWKEISEEVEVKEITEREDDLSEASQQDNFMEADHISGPVSADRDNEYKPNRNEERSVPQDIYEEKSASAIPESGNVKKGGFLKKLTAVAAGVAVVAAFIGTGFGVGSFIYKSGGVSAANGGDVSLAASDGADKITPIVYTTNFKSISEVFDSVEDAVVNISITVSTRNIWNQTYEATGSGSGIIYKIDGDSVFIVTNNHVVDGANTVSVSVTGEEQLFATLVGKDAENDLAVIKVSKDAFTSAGITDIKAAQFVSTDTAEIGETVLAIGNALGQGKTVTMGIVSAKNKNISIDGKNLTVIQTDAAINPGNSGGALVNLDGQVVGINTAKTGSQVVEGTGYAIPSYVAVGIFDQLIENGTIEKPYLGVVCFTITDTFRQMYNLDVTGVFIQEINAGSAAEKAGLRATDIITAVNGSPIASQQDLQKAIEGHKVGDTISIDFLRNGREAMQVNAVLENYNAF